MADDETPAQPTMPGVGRCSDQCPTIHGITGPLCALPYGHLGSHESEHGTVWSFMPGVDDRPAKCNRQSCGATRAEYDHDPCTREVCGLRDARPAADAGRAGEALDLDVVRADLATLLGGWWHADVDNQATADALHAVIGHVPALLAELAEVTRDRDDWKNRTHDAWDKADRDTAERITLTNERDKARGENARIHVALSHRGLRWVPDEWRVESVGDDGSGT